MKASELDTPHGPARVHVETATSPPAALVLGHGAAGGVQAPDIVTAAAAARSEGLSVVLVEQPYRVAGRRSPPRPAQLDAAWIAIVDALSADELAGLPLITGGRSMGGRVACRTADATGAAAVLCLAFPLVPPSRGEKAPQSRPAELDAVKVPTLVIQGERDRFGMPPPGPARVVVKVPGDHGLKVDLPAVAAALQEWFRTVALPAATA